MTLFSKFVRPQEPLGGRISERDLDIIEVLLRYRFSPTSELIRLVGGNEDVTHRRLRKLWVWQLINRFAFPGIHSHSEFIYYLDQKPALDTLVQYSRLQGIHPRMLDEIDANRAADYAGAVSRGQFMQLGFLKHSLMISRLHYALEQSCKNSNGKLRLTDFRQGSQIARNKVAVPKIVSSRGPDGYAWSEHDRAEENLPVEPDALFSLSVDGQPLHFCYEADRGTMTSTDMLRKLRAYYYFIKKKQQHKEAFGVHPIRAVLIETPDEARGQKLMELISHPLVTGPYKKAGLFWFTISPLLTDLVQFRSGTRPTPAYLQKPELVLGNIWALPDRSMHALTDLENSSERMSV